MLTHLFSIHIVQGRKKGGVRKTQINTIAKLSSQAGTVYEAR